MQRPKPQRAVVFFYLGGRAKTWDRDGLLAAPPQPRQRTLGKRSPVRSTSPLSSIMGLDTDPPPSLPGDVHV